MSPGRSGRLFHHSRPDLFERLSPQFPVQLLHPLDRPKQVDRRGTCGGEGGGDLVDLAVEIRRIGLQDSRAMPMAAATPMAGAPRITMERIASAPRDSPLR